jgi:CheY-like chemotaxis protein
VGARIMVVDDTESIRRLIRVNLEIEGYEVVEAADGQECLDMVDEARPDLITLDVVMPRLDGFAAATALRAERRTASLPIVMVTTQAQPADRRRADEIGVDAYITKPFEPAVLVTTIRDVLAGGRRAAPIP